MTHEWRIGFSQQRKATYRPESSPSLSGQPRGDIVRCLLNGCGWLGGQERGRQQRGRHRRDVARDSGRQGAGEP